MVGALSAHRCRCRPMMMMRWPQVLVLLLVVVIGGQQLGAQDVEDEPNADSAASNVRDLFESVEDIQSSKEWAQPQAQQSQSSAAMDAFDATLGFTGYSSSISSSSSSSSSSTSAASAATFAALTGQPQQQQTAHPRAANNKRHHMRRGQRQRTNKNGVRLLAGNFARPDAGGAGLWPPIVNVAPKATVTANATCGQSGREEYCKMSDTQAQRSRAPQCGVCHQNQQHDTGGSSSGEDIDGDGGGANDDLDKRHPIEHAIDGTARWWQSPTLLAGRGMEYVTITLDLKQLYQVVFILIKSAISPRPASWILERSTDGLTYQPWQYFGSSSEDCQQRYQLPGHHGAHQFGADDEVICSTKFSKITPLENGEMQLSLISNRPGLNRSAPELLQFTLARFVRIRLQAMHSAKNSVHFTGDLAAAEMRSFYSFRHIKIGARAMCSGHASKTRSIRGFADEQAGEIQECVCQHNTCGLSCDKCCPMFNQRAYRQAEAENVNPCERCQCHGHATECYYNPEVDEKGLSMNVRGEMSGGGVCLNCTDLTTGINCEQCVANYYRPFDVSPAASNPCRACDCDERGSAGACDPMGGQCRCKEGFTGDRCDECAAGYKGEHCQRCACDVRGTMPGGECESFCQCKLYAEGERCDRCLPGYFALREDNSEGCTKCYCSGVGTTCASSELEETAIETLHDWRITDITRTLSASAARDNETGHLVFGTYELPDVEAVYWTAPAPYLGNWLPSYGSSLDARVGCVIVRGDTSGTHTTGPSVILVGANGAKIAYGDETYSALDARRVHLRTALTEDGWYHLSPTIRDIVTPRQRRTEAYRGEAVSRAQFMQVLQSVAALLVRGTFHTDQVETVFVSAALWAGERVTNVRGERLLALVEHCECPHGYAGGSCERCEFGFARREQNTSAHERVGRCHECDCHGHAADCDVERDVCGRCEHNTYGERCERCAVGYYGNARRGRADDCQRCACPLALDSNNFSPGCQLKELSLDMNQLSNELLDGGAAANLMAIGAVVGGGGAGVAEYVCTQCPAGYTGDHCEVCDDGYYGEPMVVGSVCLECPCNGGPCDPISGRCISCLGNTEGWRCERCKAGFWGDATRGCEACKCHGIGALSNVCDSLTGQCVCTERFTGHQCDECDIGFGNSSLGCPECQCHPLGSSESFCDTDTAQCPCRMGVTGLQCDGCLDAFYNLTTDGCAECQCNPYGSVDRSCNKHTGQCQCRPNVTGRLCDQCAAGFRQQHEHERQQLLQQRLAAQPDSSRSNASITLGLAESSELAESIQTRGWLCVGCECNAIGSRNGECNPHTGQCSCHVGVAGMWCDRCAEDHYGFSDRGCKRCDECLNSAYICDDQTGRCVCPPLSKGPDCQQCAANSWGWAHRVGCRQCDCDHHGTFEQKCNLHSGECSCRQGFDGRRCDRCARGYFGYPRCQPCGCNAAGSVQAAGDAGAVQCDDRGQCPCRQLVTGQKCDQCRQATYGLDARNPAGCLRCFCFGRSQECVESTMTWGQIRAYGARNLSVEHVDADEEEYVVVVQLRGTDSVAEMEERNDLQLIPGSVGNVSMGARAGFLRPMYFQLPAQYAGDRLGSYGGWLNYSIWAVGTDGGLGDEVLERHPLVQLHTHSALVLDYYGPQIMNIDANVTYSVGMNETFWRYRFSDQNVTRAIMLTALQDVRNIYVRATAWSDFREVVISNVTLDSAYLVHGTRSNLAHSVEVCQCPSDYNGTSCQDPATGYYRWRSTADEGSEKQLIDFVGIARHCECSGRSEVCDRETGECLGCRFNSGGTHCEQCAEGYYGDPNFEDGCEPCPCPETSRNFARGCEVRNRRVHCICRAGYTGQRCDRCAHGYYGQPDGLAGKCTACDCDADGTVDSETGCHELSGQCQCKPGLTGRRCDRCDATRSTLQDGACRVCDNCTLTLLDFADDLRDDLASGAAHLDPNGIPAPWLKLLAFETEAGHVQERVDEAHQADRKVESMHMEGVLDKLESKATHLTKRTSKISNRADKREHRTEHLLTVASTHLNEAQKCHDGILDTIDSLNAYGLHTHHVNLPAAKAEAERILKGLHAQQAGGQLATETLNCARQYFDKWHTNYGMLSNQGDELQSLLFNTTRLQRRLQDSSILTAQTEHTTAVAAAKHATNVRNFEMLMDHEQLIKQLRDEVLGALDNNKLPKMDTLVEQYNENASKISGDIQRMNEMHDVVDKAVDEEADKLADMHKNLVPQADKHSKILGRRAQEYAQLFVNSRNGADLAMRASSAHTSIVEAIEAAKRAAEQAVEAVATSEAELRGEIVGRGAQSTQESGRIMEAAEEEFQKLNDLNETLRGHKKVVHTISDTIRQASTKNNDMSTILNNINNDANRNRVTDQTDMALKVSAEMREVHRKASDITADVYKLKMKLNLLEPQWDTQLGGAEENVSQSQGNIIAANRTLARLEDVEANNTEQFQRWNNSIADSMQELRDKIAKARHAAEAIRISVHTEAQQQQDTPTTGCIRSYVPRSPGLTTSNSIRMSIAADIVNDATTDGNSPILFVQGAESGTFIALELRRNRVHLAWNLGGNTGQLTHPTEVQARDVKFNDAWYQIEVNRTMNLASLSVSRMEDRNGAEVRIAKPVTGSTGSDHTRLLLSAVESRLWLGGVPAAIRPAELLAHREDRPLSVVVHKLHVDDETVGLWNFVHSQGACGAAMAGALGAGINGLGAGWWHFNGHGYATVQKKKSRMPLSKTRFSMQLQFRTFDENALLFLAVDEETKRSVSLTLHNGTLIFRIDYGNAAKLEIRTARRYNDGNWPKVEMARHFSKGTEMAKLTITNENNKEELSGSPTAPIKLDMLPNLARAVYYLGGVPPGFRSGTTKAPGADYAFLGCMRDIQVNSETYDPMESTAHFGVEPGCRSRLTQAGFRGNGWVAMPAHSLLKRANFAMVMRTEQTEALLMTALSANGSANYSLSLIGGRPFVWLQSAAAGQPVRLTANASLSDGEWHVLAVQKSGCRVELRVDDVLQDAGRFEPPGCALHLAGSESRMYLGGAPDDLEKYADLAATYDRFAGAIKDVVFNNATVAFDEQLVGFQGVQLGREGPAMGGAGASVAAASGSLAALSSHAQGRMGGGGGGADGTPIGRSFAAVPEGCHRVGSYSYEPNAFKFGDGPHSHAIVSLATRNLWQKNFSILFDFRTFYPNGVLFLAPGTKEKQKHFIGLVLRDGELQLTVRGRKRDQVTVPRRLNDGQWHRVSLISTNKILTIRVEDTVGDDRLPLSTQYRLPKRLSAANTMFVGGLSETADGSLPGELITKLEQFKGCIRRFRVNNATQDLVRPGRHFNVGQCFPSVEKGSYFPGDAFVIYKRNFHVGKYLELEFEFRTSELNGVLLSVAEPIGFPALSIELYGGKIIMSCDLGDGNPFRVETAQLPSKYSLCNNHWHNISAMYDSKQIALRIDDAPAIITLAQRAGNKVNTKSPLYIGGLPDTAPSGTLLSRDNFKGCIRNVLIRNELRDWTDMDELHNVLLSECLAVH